MGVHQLRHMLGMQRIGNHTSDSNRDRKPETYNNRPVVEKRVTVHDISGEEGKYTLDSHGFQIYKHESAEKDFLDDDKIKAQYYKETEQLLKDAYVTDNTLLLLKLTSSELVPFGSSYLTTPFGVKPKMKEAKQLSFAGRFEECILINLIRHLNQGSTIIFPMRPMNSCRSVSKSSM
jgi:hypothetical protein